MKKITCDENGRSLEVLVPKEWGLRKIKIDGGLIQGNETERCDFAVMIIFPIKPESRHTLICVELKGHDLKKAISQLETTIKILKNHNEFNSFKNLQAHAVCSRVIPHIQSFAQNQAVKFKKSHDCLLKWHSQKGIVHIKNEV